MHTMQSDQDAQGSATYASASEERVWRLEAASGVAAFELNLAKMEWSWSPHAASLLGMAAAEASGQAGAWEQHIFPDDAAKIRSAAADAMDAKNFYVEFRVRYPVDHCAG